MHSYISITANRQNDDFGQVKKKEAETTTLVINYRNGGTNTECDFEDEGC